MTGLSLQLSSNNMVVSAHLPSIGVGPLVTVSDCAQARRRLEPHPHETPPLLTPATSVASGRSTPTLCGRATPAATVCTDDGSDSDSAVSQDARGELASEQDSYHRNAHATPEYPADNMAHTTRPRASRGSGPPIHPMSLHGLTGFGVIALLVSITMTAIWNYWVGQGNIISLNISIGRWGAEVAPADETNFTSTSTSTVYIPTTTYYIPVTHTQVSIQTIIFTTTASVTETVTAASEPKPTTKEGLRRQSTLTLWERGSSPIVQCFHGPASKNTEYRYLMRSSKWRQRTLRDCLENGKRGIRWAGILCGGAEWEVDTDPHDGGLYSDSRRCWQRCEKCLTSAINKNLQEAECQVDDRGSRCVTRYVDTY